MYSFIGPNSWRAGVRRWWECSCVSASVHMWRGELRENWGVILLSMGCMDLFWSFTKKHPGRPNSAFLTGLAMGLSQAWVAEWFWKPNLTVPLMHAEPNCACCVAVLAPLCVGTDCRSVSVVTGSCQLLSQGLSYWRPFAGKVCKSVEMAEIPFSLGSKQHDDVVYILDHDWKEISLTNELVSITYLSFSTKKY